MQCVQERLESDFSEDIESSLRGADGSWIIYQSCSRSSTKSNRTVEEMQMVRACMLLLCLVVAQRGSQVSSCQMVVRAAATVDDAPSLQAVIVIKRLGMEVAMDACSCCDAASSEFISEEVCCPIHRAGCS